MTDIYQAKANNNSRVCVGVGLQLSRGIFVSLVKKFFKKKDKVEGGIHAMVTHDS